MKTNVNFGGLVWAMPPDTLGELLEKVESIQDPSALANRLGVPIGPAPGMTIRQDTAVLEITGPLFRRESVWTALFGGTTVESLAINLALAAESEQIKQIVLEIDSPGGQAAGIAELARQIRTAASRKPVTAYVDGMAASAAYWLASAADRIVTADTGLLGSIGVVGTYRPEKNAPIKIISSISPLKQATPDTEAGRAEMQRVIDELGALFVADVARYRAVSPERVVSDFGKGGLLVGASAVRAGMADGVGSFEGLFTAKMA